METFWLALFLALVIVILIFYILYRERSHATQLLRLLGITDETGAPIAPVTATATILPAPAPAIAPSSPAPAAALAPPPVPATP